jgi:hypothetical protein
MQLPHATEQVTRTICIVLGTVLLVTLLVLSATQSPQTADAMQAATPTVAATIAPSETVTAPATRPP